MLNSNPPSAGKQITIAVAIAALSTLASGLVAWGLEEVKNKIKGKNEAPPSKETP